MFASPSPVAAPPVVQAAIPVLPQTPQMPSTPAAPLAPQLAIPQPAAPQLNLQPPAKSTAGAPNYLPLVLILSVMLLIALALVIYFATKH